MYAEDVAIKNGMLKITDNYKVSNNKEFRNLFSKYKNFVGSTGNLRMSIGLSDKNLGFAVTVYMSEETKTGRKICSKKLG